MNHEATIATLNMQLDNCAKDLYEKDKRIAGLERQLAEASAPAVGQQPVKPWEDRMQEYFAQGSVRMRTPAYFMAEEITEWRKTSPAAPQAADTDKVREAIRDVEVSTSGSKGYAKAFNDGAETMREAIAGIFDFMAAQAPVREANAKRWNKLISADNNTILHFYNTRPDLRTAFVDALPAAPVQQEGGHA